MRLIGALLLAIGTVLAGCAGGVGPQPQVAAAVQPPPQPRDAGRIVIYRLPDVVGSWNQPGVLLNGRRVGVAAPGGYFVVDVPPGNYQVKTETEHQRIAQFSIGFGDVRYVRLNNEFKGIIQVWPQAVGDREGRIDLVGLNYTPG